METSSVSLAPSSEIVLTAQGRRQVPSMAIICAGSAVSNVTDCSSLDRGTEESPSDDCVA